MFAAHIFHFYIIIISYVYTEESARTLPKLFPCWVYFIVDFLEMKIGSAEQKKIKRTHYHKSCNSKVEVGFTTENLLITP